MSGGKRGLICISWVFCLALALAELPSVADAQEEVAGAAAVLVIDQDRLFAESAFGRASQARESETADVLDAENKRIQAALVAEEQELTLLRKTLSSEEFAARAEAFDQKVEQIRAEQDAKARELGNIREEDIKIFVAALTPVLGEILKDRGAAVILDKATVLVSLNAVDVTDEAIARIDAALGEPTALP